MAGFVRHFLRFSILILFQVFVLDKLRLHQLVTPYLYMVFILWMPFQTSRARLMILAFLLGFTLDSFRHHPGFHAAACVLMAYVRPFMVNLLIPQEGAETNYEEPTFRSLGGLLPYMIYAGSLTLLHHAWLFLLEAWQFADFGYFLVKTLTSTLVSLLLILVTEMVFSRSQRFRTNTA